LSVERVFAASKTGRPVSVYSKDVFTLLKVMLAPGACLLAPALTVAFAATVSGGGAQPAAAAWPVSPPPSSNGIYPLAQVHAGQHAVAYTVFQGMTPEPFGVDILGVLHNAEGPGEDMILARLTGAKAEYTGVVAGMSGSPVYIDGRLVGALAFRIGQFSKEPIAGITPIAEMLQVRNLPTDLGTLQGAGPEGSQADAESSEVHPMETPLMFSGFSAAALALWKQRAPASMAGMVPEAGIGGSGTAGVRDPVSDTSPKLEPGSSVSALLVAGDMEIAATCTVTYLEADHLLACGHPLSQFGAVSLPMTKAEVLTTLASPAGSFKIINTGATIGAFTQDRQTAIAGVIGKVASMIPVEITMHRAGAPDRSLHLQVLDQAQTTPTAMLVSLYQALQETPAYAEEATYRVRATIDLQGFAPVKLETVSVPGGFGSSALTAALTLGVDFNELYSSSERTTPFTSVHVDVDVLAGRHVATLTHAALEQTEVHAGDTVTVDATIEPYRGAPRLLRIPVKLPSALPLGEVRLLVGDSASLSKLNAAGRAGVEPIASVIRNLNAEPSDEDLYVSLLVPDAQLNIDGETLESVPLSVANLLLPAHEEERASLHSESVRLLEANKPDTDEVLRVNGEQILTIRVE
jgi:hypothetical protein